MRFHAISGAAVLSLFLSSAASAAGAPTAADAQAAIARQCSTCRFTFKSVQIAGGRKASMGETSAAGLPPGVTVYPVLASYTQAAVPGFRRDHTQNYFLYQNDFGAWAVQARSVTGNTTSDPY